MKRKLSKRAKLYIAILHIVYVDSRRFGHTLLPNRHYPYVCYFAMRLYIFQSDSLLPIDYRRRVQPQK